MSMPAFALPGDTLAASSTHVPGAGSHIYASKIQSSLAGPVTASSSSSASSRSTKATKSTISVAQSTSSSTASAAASAALPTVGDVVLARITRTNPRQASASILALYTDSTFPASNDTKKTVAAAAAASSQPQQKILHEPFPALIRTQDVRATEIDKVRMSESFRVGDIVRAVVISLGDERAYFLGTGRNELGVVIARSEAGRDMVPVSWREMREVVGQGAELLGAVELRKVAKPI
ncbi:hypothetical protein AAFC00_003412 [Neodothiora populina]|uniref:Exosome complex component CSL4 C-terminal domain-containing protein n=1 Tax=Neodothiora populina TaxID=2781224 RepID=A0ABR3PEH9_9PEZI